MNSDSEVICNLFKALMFIVCTTLCILNTKSIFETFLLKEISQTTTRESVESFTVPTFVICAEEAYNDTQKVMFTLEDFKQNTVNPRSFMNGVICKIQAGYQRTTGKNFKLIYLRLKLKFDSTD